MSGAGRPDGHTIDAAGLSLAIAATRWHAEITDQLVGPGGSGGPSLRIDARWWSAFPVRSSCRWSRPSWPAGTTRWPAWAR